jgi:hypothetical protein
VSSTDSSTSMWHVTLTVGGEPVDRGEVCAALERLSLEQPFLISARYAAERAELRYWEQADCLDDAAALALRLWGEHRASAQLPPWRVVGLEVLDRDTFQLNARQVPGYTVLAPTGQFTPF